MQCVLNAGGKPASGVTKKTDYLVVGEADLRQLRQGEQLTSKMKKALQLRESGSPIQVFGESDFVQLLQLCRHPIGRFGESPAHGAIPCRKHVRTCGTTRRHADTDAFAHVSCRSV